MTACATCGGPRFCADCDPVRDAQRSFVPPVGSLWWWEPEKPLVRKLVRVTGASWNGEEWWVECRDAVDVTEGKRYLNELGRWVEATVLELTADEAINATNATRQADARSAQQGEKA